MRPPQRAVVDDHVDRPQVEAWRHVEPSGTNCPNACASEAPVRPLSRDAGIQALLEWNGKRKTENGKLSTLHSPLSTFARLPSSAKPSKETCGGCDAGAHLFPFRTEKLSPAVPVKRGKVGRRPPIRESPPTSGLSSFYSFCIPLYTPRMFLPIHHAMNTPNHIQQAKVPDKAK